MAEPPLTRANPDRLCVIIVDGGDVDRLLSRLAERAIPATKIGSTGGFLRRGSATILSGIASAEIDELTEIVRQECHVRRELMPVQTLPFFGDGGVATRPVEVRVGGAVLFVIEIERFVRT